MEMKVSDAEGITIIHFDGMLDGQTSPAAQAAFERLLEQGVTRILANFEQLSFISSAGLRVLLYTAKELKNRQGEVRICGAGPSVVEVFEISGFNTIISLVDSEAEALEDWKD